MKFASMSSGIFIYNCRIIIAANVDGLLLCWYFIIVSLATEAD
jgi:hypothetical protein